MRPYIHARRWLTGLRASVPMLLAILISATTPAQASGPASHDGSNLKVMTYNVYSGTGFAGATDPSLPVFLQAMTNAVLDVRASDPPGRAQAVAHQIARNRPYLVSLREVFTLSTGPSKDALAVEFDYLQLLLEALATHGAYYTPVESITTWEGTVPTTFGYSRVTWRIVILVRADLHPRHFSITNVDGNRFATTITYPLPALNGSAECPVPLTGTECMMPWPRGWALADVTFHGKQFRYVNATLESNSNSRNIAQGLELLNGPLNTTRPVILAGDLNCDLSNLSDPKRLTCTRFLDAGFIDAWGAVNPSEPGFTKELPTLTMRSDYVMLRDISDAESAKLVGEEPADMTSSGVWPSNHAGAFVKLTHPQHE